MTTVKITQLPSITGANADAADVLPLVDVSLNTTNKITRQEFFNNIPSATVVGDFFIADKIVHNGDTNTSIRFPAADTVTVETSGSERLRIDSSGNVGIGTNSPSVKLQVSGSMAAGAVSARVANTDATGMATVEFSDGTNTKGQIWAGNASYASFGGAGSLNYSANSGPHVWYTNYNTGGERMRIDASGNLGLGVTPSAWGVGKAIQIGATKPQLLLADGVGTSYFGTNWYYDGSFRYKDTGSAALSYNQQFNGAHVWNTAPSGTAGNPITFTQAMTLDASGNLLVGTTSPAYASGERLSISSSGNNGIGIAIGNVNKVGIGIYNGYTATGSSTALQFQDHNSVVRGSITVTTSATAYNTSSDYRLKEDLQPISDAASRLALLNPVNFAWKADGSRTDGFIAHEVQTVIPQAVTGEKDAVDADGNPQYQGIDHSKLVPLLTAALQEALTKIEALEARIIALEA